MSSCINWSQNGCILKTKRRRQILTKIIGNNGILGIVPEEILRLEKLFSTFFFHCKLVFCLGKKCREGRLRNEGAPKNKGKETYVMK